METENVIFCFTFNDLKLSKRGIRGEKKLDKIRIMDLSNILRYILA